LRSRSTPRSCSPPSPRWRVGASRRCLAREAAGCAFRLRPPLPRATVRLHAADHGTLARGPGVTSHTAHRILGAGVTSFR
jgi:hypothetical protein